MTKNGGIDETTKTDHHGQLSQRCAGDTLLITPPPNAANASRERPAASRTWTLVMHPRRRRTPAHHRLG